MNPHVDVRYQTLTLPPPYAYTYSLRAELGKQLVTITLDWQHTDRDELTEEEIWEEGFTSDDDFQWQGTLPGVWVPTWEKWLEQTQLLPDAPLLSKESSLVMTYTNRQGKTTTGVPDDIKQWEYQLQEVVQGVYEAAQRERPLRVSYYDLSPPRPPIQIAMDISFLHRRFTLSTAPFSPSNAHKLPWERVHSLLETLYLPDYDAGLSSQDIPQRAGRYIDPGDGQWYQVGTAVVNPGKRDVLSRLHHIIMDSAAELI